MTTTNTYSTHDPDQPIVVLEDDPISLIEQVCDLVLESFADLAARLDEEEQRESEGVSQNDSRTPPAPHTATGRDD